jgi:arginyl-tRNA synthetase
MQQEIIKSIQKTCRALYGIDVAVELDRPEEQFGDFATNIAMQLAGSLRKNPRDIAMQITTELQKSSLFSAVNIAGPGFINMTISDERLLTMLVEPLTTSLHGQKIIVEYSDPNPFKPLHAGHLYTTLVGDVIARLVEHAGAQTIRLNYGGDVGLHVGKTMWAILQYFDNEDVDSLKKIPATEMGQWMGQRYAEGHIAYEENEQTRQAIKTINKKVYKVHADNDHKSTFAQIYWYVRDISYILFKELYQRLGVKEFDRFIPESEVTRLGHDTILEQKENGIFESSDGAIIFDGEKHGLHKRVFVSSEGLPTYEAKDVGLSLTKWNDYHYDQSIIITANEQMQYMQVVLKAIEQFAPDPAQRTHHLTHGLLKMQGGIKMSSRKGNVLMASDILDAADLAGRESGQASQPEIVLGAIKYAFVKNRIGSDIVYNPEESAATEGNSGPYLQYAHARAMSILRKIHVPYEHIESVQQLDKDERSLLRKLTEYNDVVTLSTRELAPHHICTYLYELAQNFNRFYESNRVVGDERQDLRSKLLRHYTGTLKSGLDLLGIHAPEKM